MRFQAAFLRGANACMACGAANACRCG